MKMRILLVAVSVVLFCFVSTVSAALISVDIDGRSDNGIDPGTMVGAAAVGSAGDQWNGYYHYTPGSAPVDPAASGPLTNSIGSVEAVTFDLGSSIGDAVGAAIQGNALLGDRAYLGPGTTGINFTFRGLIAGNAYDLYLYGVSGTQPASTYQTKFTVGGTDKTLSSTVGFDGTYVEDREYVLFSGVIADSTGTISGVVSSPVNYYYIFDGAQITGEFVPPPKGTIISVR